MRLADFLVRYRATEADLNAYVSRLPLWVNVWRGWMFFIFTLAVLFVVWKREARWLALTMIISIFAYNLVSMLSGVGRFPSIAFVLFWTPLAISFARRRAQLPHERTFDRLYRWWFTAALTTLCISLAFDSYNVAYSFVAGVP